MESPSALVPRSGMTILTIGSGSEEKKADESSNEVRVWGCIRFLLCLAPAVLPSVSIALFRLKVDPTPGAFRPARPGLGCGTLTTPRGPASVECAGRRLVRVHDAPSPPPRLQ